MKTTKKILAILFIFLFFITHTVLATDINMNLQQENTDLQNEFEEESNLMTNNEIANETENEIPTSSTPNTSSTSISSVSSVSNETFSLTNILNIIIIVVGVVLILLGIAILIRMHS